MTIDPLQAWQEKMDRVNRLFERKPLTVEDRNELQKCGVIHPYTCGGNRHDEAHAKYAEEHDEDRGQLIATEAGWICPVCNYTQPF
jgi:hypothetical protein